MKRPWFVPSPVALVCAVSSFLLLGAFGAVAALVVPRLLELLETSPRLAMFGFLALLVSPAIVVTIAHHVGHRALDRVDHGSGRGGLLPGAESFWAGAHAWLVLYGTSVLSGLVMLVIDPPELPPDARFFVGRASRMASLADVARLEPVVWVVIAAVLYEIERSGRPRRV